MPHAMCSAGSSRCSQGLVHTYINTYTGLTFKDPDGLTTSRGPLRYIRACCVELLLNCNGRSFTWQVQWSFYKGDFLGGYVHSRTHEGMRGHGFAPAHQGLLLVGHPKTSPRILSESLCMYYHHPLQIHPNDQPLLYTNTSEKLVYIHT